MLSLSGSNQVDVVEAFNSTSRYIDDLLNIDDRANPSDTEAPFFDFGLSLIRFARASSHVADFNTPNKLRNFSITNIGIINFAKPFLNFIDDTMI